MNSFAAFSSSQQIPVGGGSAVQGVRVLVIEDEEKIRELVRDFLQQRGYQVDEAGTGEEGLRRFRQGEPDIIVLDLMLPGLDGMEVCRTIRKESAVPVVMLTARSEEVDKLLGLELGADDYLTKPFSVRELEVRLRAILRRTRGEAGSGNFLDDTELLEFGPLTIDPGGQRVTLEDNEVKLTPTEFRLLMTLARNPGRVFSRLQLLDAAFGETYVGYERSIDTHISNLRKKIEEDPNEPRYVVTVYGFGYRFDG